MQNKIISTLLGVGMLLAGNAFGQTLLKKDEAVNIAMENNFDIQISNNNVEMAENNASLQNSGYLPSLNGTAGATYSNSSGTVTQKSGEEVDFDANETNGLNASIGLQYTIFDGFGRSNTYKTLQENYQISELQARQVVENTVLDIFNAYYDVARLTQDVANQKQTMVISRVRLTRAQYRNDYGQGSQLDILNAEVDYNNDSITFLTNTQLLANQKRNLNLLLGRDVTIDFAVDTTLAYANDLELETLLAHSRENNVFLLQEESYLKIAAYDVNAIRSNVIPKLSLNAGYGWSENNMGTTSFIDKSVATGPNLGATLSWNIFDGGSSRTARQNSQILQQNQVVNLQREKLNIERNLNNAWAIYQTALFVKVAQEKNVQTAQTNFDRSVDQYQLGQITSIEFRQAQLNLLNAQLDWNQAKYVAKNAELFLLQISGDLGEARF